MSLLWDSSNADANLARCMPASPDFIAADPRWKTAASSY